MRSEAGIADALFAPVFEESIGNLLVARARGDKADERESYDKLVGVMRDTLGYFEIQGVALMAKIQAAVSKSNFSKPRLGTSDFSFDAALQDLIERAPVTLKDSVARTGERIRDLYESDHVIAFVKSIDESVTERVKALIKQALRDGEGEHVAGQKIRAAANEIQGATEAWTGAYARLVYRNNANNARTAGMFKHAQDPVSQRITPAFQLVTAGDVDVRHHHAKLHGNVYTSGNPVWKFLAPPLEHNCRCGIRPVTRPQLRRMGRLDQNGEVIESPKPDLSAFDKRFRKKGRVDLGI